jgi:hypothetical protein
MKRTFALATILLTLAAVVATTTASAGSRVRVPRVTGLKVRTAFDRLHRAGLSVRVLDDPGDRTGCHVHSQSRSGLVPRGTTVKLRLTCPAPDPGPSGPGGNCDPSYSGACLDPNASDYDCAGGSGDGPLYTGPVQVVGDDHYDLDRDGDGLACESS